MFHVELRQFPNVARAFNLERAELEERFLVPWLAGRGVVLNDRSWSPEKARLTIYEGRALGPEEIGMGRGWGNVTRSASEVTAALLEQARDTLGPARAQAVAELKREIPAAAAGGPLRLERLVAQAGERYPAWRVSERLGAVEQAVWELLHEHRLRLVRDQPVAAEDWPAVLLDWRAWLAEGDGTAAVEPPAGEPEPAAGEPEPAAEEPEPAAKEPERGSDRR